MDGDTIFGWRLDHAHVTQTDQRHMQCAWDRRSRHGKHIHFFLELLETFLVTHAETLLFINNQQSQIGKLDVLRQNAVRADEDSDLPLLNPFHNLLLLLRRAETR